MKPLPASPPKSGVRRVNRKPMLILGGVILAFLIMMMIVALERADKQRMDTTKKDNKGGNSSMFASEIIGEQNDGLIPPMVPTIPDTDETTTVIPVLPVTGAKTDDQFPPLPYRDDASNESRINQHEDLQRIHMAKMQLFEEAVKAKTGVQVAAPRSSASSKTPKTREEMITRIQQVQQQLSASASDPTTDYNARLAQIKSIIGAEAAAPALTNVSVPPTTGKDYSQFDGTSDRWQLTAKVEAPQSPYELRAGFVLPATLISGINSELPGQIVAQVAQNVYDTATGKYLLIPQGSRLIGAYSSEVAYGQARVLVAWQRVVFPDGKALDIGSMPGADSAGYSGLHDQVNNHYLRIFSSALLMSGVTAGISYSQARNNNSGNVFGGNQTPSMSSELSQALGQQLGQVMARMIEKNLNIAPTLEIRPGYRFNVIVTKDLIFSKPYQAFDY